MNNQLVSRQKRPFRLVRLQQTIEIHQRYLSQLPWWRRPLVGYLAALPAVSLAFLLLTTMQGWLPLPSFPDGPLFLAVFLIALFWGVGPAVWTVLLSTLILDYLNQISLKAFDLTSLRTLLQILPFLIFGIMIAIITGQRESARRHALFAEQLAKEQAKELAGKNEELWELNQHKDRFISVASHELKTPITTIRGLVQLSLRRLKKQKELPTELQEVQTTLEKIDYQTHRLNALVEDLLILSGLRSGKLALQARKCDLVEICSEVVEDQRLLTDRSIDVDAPPKLVLQADGDRLSQVIINLVSNALKYSPSESTVQVNISMTGGKALIQVHNEGPVIPEEQQAHIFDPFYRTPEAQTSRKSGWGLGLAICKDIVERHSGRIWCESRQGQGTTFFVELPLK
jgi:signal transduction histidine kinase